MKKTILFLAVLGMAAVLTAQVPSSQQSNAPTSNSFRIVVMEPVEGSTIQGPDFNIVLGLPRATSPGTALSSDERKSSLTPTYQIWVDGKDYGNLPIGQNVFNVAGASPGLHKIVIAAKNTAGELIDRKEFSVTTRNAQIAETRQAEPAPAPAYAPPPPAPAPAYVPPAPAPQAEYTTESPTLAKTATSYPLAAAVGLILLGAGILIRRG